MKHSRKRKRSNHQRRTIESFGKKILQLLSKRLAYKEIADHFSIYVSKVRQHFQHIYEKLLVHYWTAAINKVFLSS